LPRPDDHLSDEPGRRELDTFYYINGAVAELGPQLAVLDCQGVGYALNVSANTLSRLKMGESAKLYTYCHIREDLFDLYGFYSLTEKRSFEMLLGVSGVGPKLALSVLSGVSPEGLAIAILGGDERALTAIPGVGKRIAQRLIVELKDKLAKEAGFDGSLLAQGSGAPFAPQANSGGKLADASAALIVLGYSGAEAASALKGIDVEKESLEDIIRLALKNMLKGN